MRNRVESWQVLQLVDTCPEASFSQSSLERLHSIEESGPGTVGYFHGSVALCPAKTITRDRSFLNALVDVVCNVKQNDDEKKSKHGDHLYIPTDRAIRLMARGLNLERIGQFSKLGFTSMLLILLRAIGYFWRILMMEMLYTIMHRTSSAFSSRK